MATARPRATTETSVAVYGRTYLDAEVTVPESTLAEGKGKVDVAVDALFGGFACNAARALVGRLPSGAIRVVTLSAWLDWPRLRAALPPEVELDALLGDDGRGNEWPPVSVIINPGGACKLLRAPGDDDAAQWRIDRVAAGALAAPLQIVGRVPERFVGDLLERVRSTEARVAWVGGHALSRAHEAELDLVCVNTAEAQALTRSTSDSPRELATVLAERAMRRERALVRVVTGRGAAPTAAAVRDTRGRIVVHEHAPPKLARGQLRRLKGAGDVFAATFLVDAVIDSRGAPRPQLDVEGALATAQRVVGHYIRRGIP